MIFEMDRDPHPGMDAALEPHSFTLTKLRTIGRSAGSKKYIVRAGRLRHKISVDHLRALRGRHRVTRGCIQGSNKSTAELPDAGKGMRFTAKVFEQQHGPFLDAGICRSEPPGSYRFLEGSTRRRIQRG